MVLNSLLTSSWLCKFHNLNKENFDKAKSSQFKSAAFSENQIINTMLLGLSELSDSLDENVINVTVSLTVETKGFFIYILDTLTNIVWYLFFKCCINFRLFIYVVTSFIFLIFMFSLKVTTCFDSVNLMTIFKQVLNRLKVSSFTYKFV